MAREALVRPTRTSWGAVIDGWLATVGVAAILTPIVGVLLANWYPTRGYASTVPILIAVAVSYLVGGYVAGRMAGYRTSWHGMMVAFFGLFVVLALLIVDIALGMGAFGDPARLVQIMPLVLGVALFESAETFAFGGALGLLIAIFAAWLGGLLAPARITAAVASTPGSVPPTKVVEEKRVTTTEVHRPRGRFRLLPSAGQKGGERVEETAKVERVERVDRTEPS
jgi:MFS family permease